MIISVILPCFNESENVKRFVPELWPVLESLGIDFEVVAVDDGSSDDTAERLAEINDPRLRIVKHAKNMGLGAAVRTGIAAAQGDYTVILDADFTFHPKLIVDLWKTRNEFAVDFVIGSPALGGYGEEVARWRIVISKIANFIYSQLLGKPITSVNQILRLYRTADLKSLNLQANGFEINAEILFKLVYAGKSFKEIPAQLTNRLYGVSKLNYKKELIRHAALVSKVLVWRLVPSTR